MEMMLKYEYYIHLEMFHIISSIDYTYFIQLSSDCKLVSQRFSL